MPFNVNAVPNEQNVREAIDLEKGLQLEFIENIPHGLGMAKLVSAFANTAGGWILVGVREVPKQIVGCDYPKLSASFNIMIQRLRPSDVATIHRVDIDGKPVGVVAIHSSHSVVASDAGIFTRVGEMARPMSVQEIEAKLLAVPAPTNHQMAEALELLGGTVTSLRADLQNSQRIKNQWKSLLIGFLLGIFASYLANYIPQVKHADREVPRAVDRDK